MNPKDKKTINRRGFVKSSTIAIVAANCLGLGKTIVNAASATHLATADAVDEVMKAAVSNVLEINNFLKKLGEAAEALKKTKVPEEVQKAQEAQECYKTWSLVGMIVRAVVVIIAAIVVAVFTFGAGAPMTALAVSAVRTKVNEALKSLSELEAHLEKRKMLVPEIRVAIQKYRDIAEAVIDAAVARDIFFHISQDRTHAAKLLEAARAKNRAAIEEMLKRDVPGSNVEVREVKEDNGLFLNVRIGNLTHCLSTSSQCSGRALTVTK